MDAETRDWEARRFPLIEMSIVPIPADPGTLLSSAARWPENQERERLERVQRERDGRPVAGGECFKDY